MSDFLTRLAQRQLGQIATIEPRVAPLYSAAAEFVDRSLAEETEYHPVSQTHDAVQVHQRKSLYHPALQTHDAVQVHQRKPLQVPPTRLPADMNNVKSIPQKPPVPEQKGSGDPVPSIEAHSATAEPQISRRRLVAAEASLVRDETDSVVQTQTPTPVQVVQQSQQEKTEVASPEKLLFVPMAPTVPVTPVPLVKQMQSESAQRVPSFMAPPILAGQNHFLEQETPAGEAPIHVTIGRIEVTAVTPPVPPKRSPEVRKQTMSLDDYLTRRQRRQP